MQAVFLTRLDDGARDGCCRRLGGTRTDDDGCGSGGEFVCLHDHSRAQLAEIALSNNDNDIAAAAFIVIAPSRHT